MVELSLLNTGRRVSSQMTDGGGVVVLVAAVTVTGGEPVGLAGGLCGNAKAVVCGNVGLCCSGKKLTIELVGLSDNEPVGDARSEPVLMLSGGLSGSVCIVWLIAGGWALMALAWAAARRA